MKLNCHREEPFSRRTTWRSQPFISTHPELFSSAHPEPVEGCEIFPCHSEEAQRPKNLGGGKDDEIATSFTGRTRNDTQ